MKNKFLMLIPILLTGCAGTCQELGKMAYIPPTVPNQMAIMVDSTGIQADEPGAQFLGDYVKARNQLKAISLECSKK
jgi:hypothetical protein